MLLSIIIVSYNTKELLEQCLESIVSNIAVKQYSKNSGIAVKQYSKNSGIALKQYSGIDKKERNKSLSKKLNSYKAKLLSYEIIVVDNNSTDGTKEYLKEIQERRNLAASGGRNLSRQGRDEIKISRSKFPNFKVIFNNDNTGFAKANNQGIKIAEGKYILLLNSDTIVKDGALEILVDYLENHPDTAAVSPLLLNPDNTPQLEYFMRFPNLWQIFFYHNKILRPFCKFVPGLKNKIYIFPQEKPFQSEQLPGAALMARREAFQKVGLLDEDYPFFYEDVDWCYRAKVLKQKLVIVPAAKVVHLKGGSWKKEKKRPADFYQGVFNSLLLFVKKNYGEKEEKKFRRAIKINEFFKFRNFR